MSVRLKQLIAPLTALAILITTLLSSGCIMSGVTGQTHTVTDMLGRRVEVPTTVERVVGIEAGALRLITYLGCTDRVVGVEEVEYRPGRPYTFAHPELQTLPSIGPIHGGDAELIVAQQPDVIFWTYTTTEDATELQAKTGIPVVALDYGDLSEGRSVFYDALRLVGRVLDVEPRAQAVISYIDGTITDLGDRVDTGGTDDTAAEAVPSCYIAGVAYRGAHGMCSTEPTYSPFRFLSAPNVAAGVGSDHAFIDKEKLLEWDPEIIFVDEHGLGLIRDELDDPSYQSLAAVKSGRLYGVLPYNWYTANIGTILANAYYIGTVLYPAAFDDIDPAARADAIYTELLGAPVYDDMAAMFGGYERLDIGH